jgi:hypothetical protein
MVFWCKNCGAFMGLRPPVRDWTIDRNDYSCARCIESVDGSAEGNQIDHHHDDLETSSSDGRFQTN